MRAIIIRIADSLLCRTLLVKIFSFASVGMVNIVVDVSTFAFAFYLLHLSVVLSNIVAWLTAVTNSYIMNSKVTFRHETAGVLTIGRFLRFALSGIVGVVVATTVLVLLSAYTNVPTAKLISIMVAFGVNFSISHFIIFRVPETDAAI